MTRTLTVEGENTGADTRTLLTTQASVTAPSRITPKAATAIKHIFAAASAEGLADGSAVHFIRISGSAVKNGEQTLIVSAGGRIAVQTGSDAAPAFMAANVYENVNIAINGGDTIDIAAEMAGTDIGTARAIVTLVFGNADSFKQYRSREGDITAVNTKTQLTTLGSETAPGPLLVPAGVKRLLGVIAAVGSNHAAAAASAALLRLEGPGLSSGSETLAVYAGGVPVATGGNNTTPGRFYPLDVPVVESQEILVFGEMGDADPGTYTAGATLVFGP